MDNITSTRKTKCLGYDRCEECEKNGNCTCQTSHRQWEDEWKENISIGLNEWRKEYAERTLWSSVIEDMQKKEPKTQYSEICPTPPVELLKTKDNINIALLLCQKVCPKKCSSCDKVATLKSKLKEIEKAIKPKQVIHNIERKRIMETNILDNLKEKFTELLAKEVPDEDSVNGTSPIKSQFSEYIQNLGTYATRIADFNRKIDTGIGVDSKELSDKEVNTYQKAKELLEKMVIDTFQDSNANAKARYDREHNIYNTRTYGGYPVKALGEDKDEITAFFLAYFDISSLELNKNATWERIKNNPILVDLYNRAYGDDRYDNTDIYFDTFLNATDEEKLQLVKDHIEFTHIAIADDRKMTIEKRLADHPELPELFKKYNVEPAFNGVTYILEGTCQEKFNTGDGVKLQDNPNEVRTVLNLTSI